MSTFVISMLAEFEDEDFLVFFKVFHFAITDIQVNGSVTAT